MAKVIFAPTPELLKEEMDKLQGKPRSGRVDPSLSRVEIIEATEDQLRNITAHGSGAFATFARSLGRTDVPNVPFQEGGLTGDIASRTQGMFGPGGTASGPPGLGTISSAQAERELPGMIARGEAFPGQAPKPQTLGVSAGTTSVGAAGSVVDFLKSRGFTTKAGESLFSERSQMFSSLGLDQNLGEFRGSAEQNIALLNRLGQLERDKGVSISPTNLVSFLQAGGQVQPLPTEKIVQGVRGGIQLPTLQSQTQAEREIRGIKSQGIQLPTLQSQTQAPEGLVQGVQGIAQQVQSLIGRAQTEGITDASGNIIVQPGMQKQTTTGEFTGGVIQPQVSPLNSKEIIEGVKSQGIQRPTLSQATQPLTPNIPEVPSAQGLAGQALEMVQRKATFPLQKEAAEAQKAEEQLKGQAEKEKVIQQMASKGLTFSGIREKAVANVDAETLARTLGVDRKFALLIAQGLESAAQDIAKQAQQGRKEAIDSLEALGFAINPLTGAIEPTLAARKEEGVQQRAEAADIRAEQAAERADIRLQLAEEAAARAEQGVQLSEAERARDNARQVIGNEALYNTLSSADKQKLWQAAGMSGNAPAHLTGKTETGEFITPNFFTTIYTPAGLLKAAKDDAKEFGVSVRGRTDEDISNEYLLNLMKTVKSYRQAGFTDQDIIKLMQ